MKVAARIVVPILAGLLGGGMLIVFFLWQVHNSSVGLGASSTIANGLPRMEGDTMAIDEPIDTGDRSLVHLRQGDIEALQGNWVDAQTEYQASVDAGGGLPALRKLAQAQLQRRNLDGVRATMKKLKDAGMKDEDLLLLQVIVDLRTGDLTKARDLLESAADSPQKHYGLALLSIIQGNNDDAKAQLVQVQSGWDPLLRSYAKILQSAYDEFALFPESRPIHLTTLLSRSLAQVQECELALPLLSQVVTQQDDYRDAWIVQGYCELTTERLEEALASFERAYALDPEKPEIQYFLGRSYSALGDHKNALTFLRYAWKNDFQPEGDVRRLIAREALAAGDSLTAIEQERWLIESKDADIGSFQEFVTLSLAQGDKDGAYSAATKAVGKWPSDARAFELLGIAAAELGKNDEAKSALAKALELDPMLSSAKERLGKL